MVGPVGIQHTDLGHGRVAVLLACIIILDMLKIAERHSQI